MISLLPTEILETIFQYVSSHKHILQISIVCKSWHLITRQPQFYYTIHIENSQQFEKFITMATTTKIAINKNDDHQEYIGKIVRHIILEHYFKENRLTMKGIKRLYDACPYLYTIDYLDIPVHMDETFSFNTIHYWPLFTMLPKWLTKNEDDWYQRIKKLDQDHEHQRKIKQLQFSIHSDLIQGGKNDDDEIKKNTFIQLQLDKTERKRKVRQLPTSFDEDYIHTFLQQIEQNDDCLNHYGMIMIFPLSSYAWSHLEQLSLDFESYLINTIETVIHTFQLDERTLEAIHESCPSLTSLRLKGLFLNISDQYLLLHDHDHHYHPNDNSNTQSNINKSTITSLSSLFKKLSLDNCHIQQHECFHYLLKKYANIASLTLSLRWSDDVRFILTKEEIQQYRTSIYQLITGLKQLSALSVHMSAIDAYDYLKWNEHDYITYSGYWPHYEMMDWLKEHPHQLSVLSYPFDLHSLDQAFKKEENSDNEKDLQQYAYLDHLKELILLNESHIMKTYNYLIYHGKRDYISKSLTSLTIHYNGGTTNNSDLVFGNNCKFYFNDWLTMLPQLKTLELEEMDIITTIHQQQDKKGNGFKLKELNLKSCQIKSKDGLTTICRSSPSLRVLKLYNIIVSNSNSVEVQDQKDDKEIKKMDDDDGIILMDAPHLIFDELLIQAIFYADGWTDEIAPFDLKVIENRNNHLIHLIKLGDDMYPLTKMEVNCQSVDILHCLNYM